MRQMKSNKSSGKIQSDSTGKFMTLEAFMAAKGETFGSNNYLAIQPGQAAGPFIMTRAKMETINEDYDPAKVYYATGPDKVEISMPVSASFQNQAISAKLAKGSKFLVARLPDKVGKKGRSKDKTLQIYQIKLLS